MKITSYKVNGKTYYKFNIYLGKDEQGKEIRTNRQGFATKKNAQIEYLRLKDAGTKKLDRITLDEAYQEWLKSYKLTVRSSTYLTVVRGYKNHIKPEFGAMDIRDITLSQVQSFANELSAKMKNYGNLVSILQRVLEHQKRKGTIESNPVKELIRPKKRQHTQEKSENFYTKQELILFLELAKEQLPFKFYVYFHLLAYTGMRRAEALALLKADIDTEKKQIKITKTLSRGPGDGKVVNNTKTQDGNRVIDIDDLTLDLLVQLMQTNDSDKVFIDENSNYLHLSTPIKYMYKIFKNNDIKRISLHGLRHTHCSLLFEAGASIKEVQHRLGHKDIKTTLDIYTHLTKNQKQETVSRFIKFMDQT